MRRWIAILLCLVLAMTGLYIPSETAQAETSYDEAKVLDEIADSWLTTCRSNASCCEIGLTLYPIAKFSKVQIDAIRSQIAEDILEGYKETTTVAFELNVEEFGAAFGEDVENTLKAEINTYYETQFAEELEEQLAHMDAKNNIDSIVKKSEMAEGVTVEDAIKDNYSFIVGMVSCEAAIKFFDEALKTSNLNDKREKMIAGTRLATIGCEMSIEDADTLIKNPDDTPEDLMKKIAESAIDVVGKVVPQVEVAGKVMEAITITADLSMKALSMANKLDALAGFMNSPESIDEDPSAFFDALSNQYGLYTFEISELEVIMEEYKGYLVKGDEYAKVVVPEDIYGFTVTGFSDCFAEGLDITEITIPSGVTFRSLWVVDNCDNLEIVHYNAIACEGSDLGSFFYRCDSDFEVIIGEDVTVIPERFISSCGISSIVFPEGITTMQAASLMNCANLKTVTIPSTVTLFDIGFADPGVVSNCGNLETVYYNAVEAEGGFDNGVFSHCGNDATEMSIIFGEEVNATPTNFLYDCGVKSVEFPEGMTLIREYAITKCQRLESITIPSTITKLSEDYVSDYVFSECNNLKTVNYNARNAMGYLVNIFYNIQSDFEINFGEGIEEIPEYFIVNCGITSISFPEGVVTINENCLVNCDSLEYVTVPSTVTAIGYDFVADCENIDTIYYNAKCFEGTTSAIISNCGNIDSPCMKVVLGDDVTTVPENFIENCGITNFTYPEGVTTINTDSLLNCSALKTVVIPSTVTSISNNVVSGCENLSDIYYSATDAQMMSSYGYVFNNCGNASGLDIHFIGEIETIPSKFMYNCGVSSVTFPEGITTMGSNILVSCEKLETVTLPSSLSENSGSLINSCDNLKTLNYHTSNINNGDSVYDKSIVYDCDADFVINFGTSVTGLPSHFVNYSGIISIDLPASVTYVGYSAFYGCKSLVSVRFGNPNCEIYAHSYTLPVGTTIYGYFDSTAYAYAVKYDREFELIKEEHTGTLGVNDNFYYNYDETTQTLTIIGADEFELYTDEHGSKYVDMPDYTVKKVFFRDCTFTGSLYGLLGKYKNSVEEVVFENCDTEKVTNISNMFSGCRNLMTLELGDFDTSSVVDMSELFVACHKLKNIDLSSFEVYSGCNTNGMFSNDLCVEVINTPYYMDENIEIMLPYEFVDENEAILTSITSENRRETINIHRIMIVVGDVNSDGVVDNLDRMTLSRYLADWAEYTEDITNMEAADVNKDGVVDNLDRMVLSRHLADWEGYEVLPYTE